MRDEANAIIVKLMQSTELDNCIKKVDPHLQDDLKAELALALLETDPEKIVLLFNRDSLRFYAVRIIINMTSATGPFYKRYRIAHDEFKDVSIKDEDLTERIEKEAKEDKALKSINCLEWYNGEMIQLYQQEGTYRNMEKRTRIPLTTCQNVVKGSLDLIANCINIMSEIEIDEHRAV